MDEQIHDVLAGNADPHEEEAVRRWRAASPDNDRSFLVCARAFDTERAMEEALDIGEPPAARDVVWLAEAREAARRLTGSSPGAGRRGWWRPALGLAAASLIAVGGALLYRAGVPESAGLQVDTFLTGDDDPVTMRLTDGSVVRLAPGSQIRMLPGGGRTVELDGRAYFAIPRDPERPFVVRTRAGDVRVLGTRFEADAAGDSTRVLVVEGQVALAGISHEAKIEALQVGKLRNGRVEATAAVSDMGSLLDWIGDFVVFQATPLDVAMDEIAHRYNLRYEILDEAYARRDLTMWFAGQPVDEVVDVICAVLGAKCSIQADLIRIGE